ncbi:hypothetical protein BST61_g6732 [Cercospora zeina]
MRASNLLCLLPGLLHTAYAAPADIYSSLNTRNDDNDAFKIHVHNNCPWTKQFALYQITPSFGMKEMSKPLNIASKNSSVIEAPYKALGMRLSGHAEWGTAGQWKHQALFECGYAAMEYGGASLAGTAYDASVMKGSDADIGIGIYPIPNGKGSKTCESKTCFPWNCPAKEG